MTCTASQRRWRVRPPAPFPGALFRSPSLCDTRDREGLLRGRALNPEHHTLDPPLPCPEGVEGETGQGRSGAYRPQWPQAPAKALGTSLGPRVAAALASHHCPKVHYTMKASPALSPSQRTPQATPGWAHQNHSSPESWLPTHPLPASLSPAPRAAQAVPTG